MAESALAAKLRAEHAAGRTEVELMGEKMFVTPMTLGELHKINAMFPNGGPDRQIEILIQKCRDADGKPIFTRDDRLVLKNEVRAELLSPIFAAINGPSVADQAKNSAATAH